MHNLHERNGMDDKKEPTDNIPETTESEFDVAEQSDADASKVEDEAAAIEQELTAKINGICLMLRNTHNAVLTIGAELYALHESKARYGPGGTFCKIIERIAMISRPTAYRYMEQYCESSAMPVTWKKKSVKNVTDSEEDITPAAAPLPSVQEIAREEIDHVDLTTPIFTSEETANFGEALVARRAEAYHERAVRLFAPTRKLHWHKCWMAEQAKRWGTLTESDTLFKVTMLGPKKAEPGDGWGEALDELITDIADDRHFDDDLPTPQDYDSRYDPRHYDEEGYDDTEEEEEDTDTAAQVEATPTRRPLALDPEDDDKEFLLDENQKPTNNNQ